MKEQSMNHLTQKILSGFIAVFTLYFAMASALVAAPPKVGEIAPDFTLKTLDDTSLRLSELTSKSNVVLIVLRGWPGYQCPICERQVQEFIQAAPKFTEAGAQVLFVYPGPAADLKAHAEEFKTMKGKQWPGEFLYALDPDYSMVNTYDLRWDAPNETAYPSTIVIDKTRTVRFVKISHSHGDRTKAADVISEVKKLKTK